MEAGVAELLVVVSAARPPADTVPLVTLATFRITWK
jgi:hypothetical protein